MLTILESFGGDEGNDLVSSELRNIAAEVAFDDNVDSPTRSGTDLLAVL